MLLFCIFGRHKWSEKLVSCDIVKGTGFHFLFWSSAVQKAERQCVRCKKIQKCWRNGMCGIGGSGSKWRKMSPKKEAYIDSLPNVFQS